MKIQWVRDDGLIHDEKEVDTELALAALAELFVDDVALATAVYESVDGDKQRFRTMLLNAVQRGADAGGFPGPDVVEHDDGYDGPCYCQSCMSYA